MTVTATTIAAMRRRTTLARRTATAASRVLRQAPRGPYSAGRRRRQRESGAGSVIFKSRIGRITIPLIAGPAHGAHVDVFGVAPGPANR
jgi:hypothetical protein